MPAKNEQLLREKANNLPKKPGIYFFKGHNDKVIYIGKARSLKDRVRSYFLDTSDSKIRKILSETNDFDFILTGSEREAAFLENNFIRKNQPKYNIRLKDDKSFPYLKITLQHKFPGIYLTRRTEKDNARYFGPFSPAHQARKTIHLITKFFGIRSCQEPIPGKRKRPCLEYDLKLCSAPCARYVSETQYNEDVENSLLFLEGKVDKLYKIVKQKMRDTSSQQKFEQAAHWRDLALAIEQIKNKPKLISIKAENEDIFGFAREKEQAALYVFMMRSGKVIESEHMILRQKETIPDEEILFEQLTSFYRSILDIPEKIILPFSPNRKEKLLKNLEKFKGGKTKIIVPQKGNKQRLVELANRNAAKVIHPTSDDDFPTLELKDTLGLKTTPKRIEGFDISNTGGKESVGSLVVFDEGQFQKKSYRKYKIKTVEGPDDVSSLKEVIHRRYTKLQKEKGVFPDLILVDGGKGQLNAVRKALDDLKIKKLPVISLAKKEETIFTPYHKKGLRLDRTSPALKLVQSIRDESHRFALSYHRQKREKTSFSSLLDDIPGIGKKRKAILLLRYKSLKDMKEAPREELSKVIGNKAAKELLKKLKKRIKNNQG